MLRVCGFFHRHLDSVSAFGRAVSNCVCFCEGVAGPGHIDTDGIIGGRNIFVKVGVSPAGFRSQPRTSPRSIKVIRSYPHRFFWLRPADHYKDGFEPARGRSLRKAKNSGARWLSAGIAAPVSGAGRHFCREAGRFESASSPKCVEGRKAALSLNDLAQGADTARRPQAGIGTRATTFEPVFRFPR